VAAKTGSPARSVAGSVLRLHTPPGGLVGALLHGREAGSSFPSGDDTSVRSRFIDVGLYVLPGRFKLSDGCSAWVPSLDLTLRPSPLKMARVQILRLGLHIDPGSSGSTQSYDELTRSGGWS
jgi:hypothetical protein